MDVTTEDLQEIYKNALEDPLPPEEAAEQWLHWFKKRAEKILKTSASFGHTYATLDLPLELSSKLIPNVHKPLLTQIQKLLPGSKAYVVEEEYEGKLWYKIEVSWSVI